MHAECISVAGKKGGRVALMRVLFSFFVLIVCIGLYGEDCFCEESVVYAVWASPAPQRTTTIHYAQRVDGRWGEVKQLAINKGLHVTPVIAADTKGTLWIIWVEQTADENILRYAVIRRNGMETGRVGAVGGEQSYAPAIMIDNQARPWIAWSGVVDDTLADIFTSRWDGSGWEKPLLVNTKNQMPDITPILGLGDNNIPWVSWFGFNASHRYVQFVAEWQHDGWHVDKKTLKSKNIIIFINQKMGVEIRLPDQAAERVMGAVFVNQGNEIQSISERFIHFQ